MQLPSTGPTRRQFLSQSTSAAALLGLNSAFRLADGLASDDDVLFLTPNSLGYDRAATPFNKRIKTRPALLAACQNEAGVTRAVRHAIEHNLRIAIKSGGHSFEGLSLNADGLVIDVSAMNEQQLDGTHYTAGPGVQLAHAYDYLLPRGRLLPMGSCGTVGLSGLTLGGGYGLFARRYGLTCDHLTGVRMIDGTGKLRDSQHEEGLLWACRGGGNGNFGIITQMRFETHAAPSHLPRHRIKFRSLSAKSAASLCERWFQQTQKLPTDAFSAFILNRSMLTVLITYFEKASASSVQAVADAIAGTAGESAPPAKELLAPAVRRYYGAESPLHFKNVSAGFYRGFADLQNGIVDVFQHILDGRGMVFQINTLGGAIADPAKVQTAAYPHRAYPYLGELQCYWEQDSQTNNRVAQVNAVQQQLKAMGINRHYRNYPSLELDDWSTAYFGRKTYIELRACKRIYDPHDRIGHAQSITV